MSKEKNPTYISENNRNKHHLSHLQRVRCDIGIVLLPFFPFVLHKKCVCLEKKGVLKTVL